MPQYIKLLIWLIVSLFPRLRQEHVLQQPRFASVACTGAGSYHLSHPQTSAGELNNESRSYLSLTVAHSAGTRSVEVLPPRTPRHPRLCMISDLTTVALLREILMMRACAFPSLHTMPIHPRYHRSPSIPGAQATEIPSCHPLRSPFPRRQVAFILPV